MTIKRGEDWGVAGGLPADGIVVRSDAEARQVVTEHRRAGTPVPPLGLLGGDLCRTLGGTGNAARLDSEDSMRLPVDLGSVLIDGRLHWFVAHLVARRSWWSGRIVAVMNAQFVGPWDVAPRSHPNDGRLDVVDSDMPLGERFKARSRLRTGSHVPHPRIKERRIDAVQIELTRATPIRLDGDLVGSARRLSVRIEPDALTCVV